MKIGQDVYFLKPKWYRGIRFDDVSLPLSQIRLRNTQFSTLLPILPFSEEVEVLEKASFYCSTPCGTFTMEYTQIAGVGGLWDQAMQMYPYYQLAWFEQLQKQREGT